MNQEKQAALTEFADLIRHHLIRNNSYSYRTVSIDGVLCYPVIHKHKQILNFECVHVMCRVNRGSYSSLDKYSVHHHKYKSIEDAILYIEKVVATYKLFHGDLISPYDYKLAKLEEQFHPYTPSQVCCVCYENTLDTTVCDHHLCLKCREICVLKNQYDCPICRNPGIAHIYNIDNGLINNNQYKSLREIVDAERRRGTSYAEQFTPFNIYAFIDRIGARRSPSSDTPVEMINLDEDEELSEVSEIDLADEDSEHELA